MPLTPPRAPAARRLPWLAWSLALALLIGGGVPVEASARVAVQQPRKHRIVKKKPIRRRAPVRPVRQVRRPGQVRPASAVAPKTPQVLARTVGPEVDPGVPAGTDELATLLRAVPGKGLVVVGLIVDAATGEVVLDLDSRKVVFPASVEKMFTTAAALRALPPDRPLVTDVRAAAVQQGATPLLVLVGAGDPTMTSGDYARLAQAVRARGITRIGRLLVDAGVFDDRLPRGFDEKATDAAYRAPVGGLQADGGTLAVAVRPGAVDAPPAVEVTPAATDAVVVRNLARTVAGKKDALSVTTRPLGRQTEIVVSGTVAARRIVVGSGRRRVADASFFAAAVWRDQLRRQGIDIDGATVFGPAGGSGATGGSGPAALTTIASHTSPALQRIVETTNKISHNGYAETLYKLVGAHGGGVPATAEKSEAAVRKALEGLDIRWQGVALGNGSGLYHSSKVTCQAVVDLVRGMAGDTVAGPLWKSSLAVGGKDGTLRGRLHHPATRGRVFAKTGTLDDVLGLAGYAEGAQKSYYFAFFYNNVRGGPGAYRAAHDRVLRRLLGGG